MRDLPQRGSLDVARVVVDDAVPGPDCGDRGLPGRQERFKLANTHLVQRLVLAGEPERGALRCEAVACGFHHPFGRLIPDRAWKLGIARRLIMKPSAAGTPCVIRMRSDSRRIAV